MKIWLKKGSVLAIVTMQTRLFVAAYEGAHVHVMQFFPLGMIGGGMVKGKYLKSTQTIKICQMTHLKRQIILSGLCQMFGPSVILCAIEAWSRALSPISGQVEGDRYEWSMRPCLNPTQLLGVRASRTFDVGGYACTGRILAPPFQLS
jgi:hypothetical protein